MARTSNKILCCLVLAMAMSAAAWAGDATKSEAGVAAYVGGKPIAMADVDAKALGTNMKLAQSVFDARNDALNQIIMERLLADEAKAKGITTEALLAKKIAEKTAPVTDEQISAYYDANKSRMRGKALNAVSGSIRNFLASSNEDAARRNLLRELKQKSEVRILLEPPRVEIAVADDEPSKGPKDAKVTIVEYTDYQ